MLGCMNSRDKSIIPVSFKFQVMIINGIPVLHDTYQQWGIFLSTIEMLKQCDKVIYYNHFIIFKI